MPNEFLDKPSDPRLRHPRRDAPLVGRGVWLRTTERAGAILLEAAGEVDLATVRRWDSAVADAIANATPPQRMLIDLARVTFMGCCALPALVAAHERGRHQRTPIAVVAASQEVRRLFALTGVIEWLPLFPTVGSALNQPL